MPCSDKMAALTVSHVIGTAVMCAGACTAPMIALLFPRAGPERAVSLAMRNSPLLRKLMPAAWQEDVHSQRTADVKKLQQLLNSGLVVVTGQRVSAAQCIASCRRLHIGPALSTRTDAACRLTPNHCVGVSSLHPLHHARSAFLDAPP